MKRAPSLIDTGETLTSSNSGSYTFAVPDTPDHGGSWGNQYQLCLTTSGSGTTASKCSATFTMQAKPSIDSVTVSPSSVVLGSELNIGWSFTGAVSNVKIHLLRNDAVDQRIVSSVPALARSYKWTVPSSGITVGNNVFKVRVQDRTDSSVSAVSAGTFSVSVAPSLSVLVPTASSTWTRDSTALIVFSSSGIDGQRVSVKVYDNQMAEALVVKASLVVTGGGQTVMLTKAQTKSLAAKSGYRVLSDRVTGALAAQSDAFAVEAIGVTPTGTLTVGAPNTCIAGEDCT